MNLETYLENLPAIYNNRHTKAVSRDIINYLWQISGHSARNATMAHSGRSCGHEFAKGEPVYICPRCSSSPICHSCFDPHDHEDHGWISRVSNKFDNFTCHCGDDEYCNEGATKTCKAGECDMVAVDMEGSLTVIFEYMISVFSRMLHCEPGQGYYYLVAYNDDALHFDDTARYISQATGKVIEFGNMVTQQMNLGGRAKVSGSKDPNKLRELMEFLQNRKIRTHLVSETDLFMQEVCEDLAAWVKQFLGSYDISTSLAKVVLGCTHGKVGIPSVLSNRVFSSPPHWHVDPVKWGSGPCQNLDPALHDVVHQFIAASGSFNSTEKPFLEWASRLQYLLFFDSYLWKSIRLSIHTVILSLFTTTNSSLSCYVAAQYMDIYPQLMDSFAQNDKENQMNIVLKLHQQVMDNPKFATFIAQHRDITKMLASGLGLITENRAAVSPMHMDYEVGTVKFSEHNANKAIHIFQDIGSLCYNCQTPEVLLTHEVTQQFCDILQHFHDLDSVVRRENEHVEFENNKYPANYFYFTSVMLCVHLYANCLTKVDENELFHYSKEVLDVILARGLRALEKSRELEFTSNYDSAHPLKLVQIGDIQRYMINFTVGKNAQSFLHPLSYFFTFVLQFSYKNHTIGKYVKNKVQPMKFLWFAEYAMSSQVFLAQIKVGHWVRNGNSITSQAKMYSQHNVREFSLFRDIYMLQFLMSQYDPTSFLVLFLKRWGLTQWVEGYPTTEANAYDDPETAKKMIEAALSNLITLLSDVAFIAPKDPENMTHLLQREVIHSLCLQPTTYANAIAEIPDVLSGNPRFDAVLKELTVYTAPHGLYDSGLFQLKDKYIPEVDPYFIGFNASKRYEAENTIRKYQEKKRQIPYKDTFIPAVNVIEDLRSTDFMNLYSITSEDTFGLFLKNMLVYLSINEVDYIFSKVLHLVHLLLVNNGSVFSPIVWREFSADAGYHEGVHYESIGSLLYRLIKAGSYSNEHGKIRECFRLLRELHVDIDGYLQEQVQNYDNSILLFNHATETIESAFEKKRRLAKLRAEKLKAKFAKQQQEFSNKNKDADDDTVMEVDVEPLDQLDGGSTWMYPEELCTFCRIPDSSETFGMYGYISMNNCIRDVPFENKYWFLKAFSEPADLDGPSHYHQEDNLSDELRQFYQESNGGKPCGPGFLANHQIHYPLFKGCGHGAHLKCYMKNLLSVKLKHTQITKTVLAEIGTSQMVCPLCKSLSNILVPVVASQTRRNKDDLFSDTLVQSNRNFRESGDNFDCPSTGTMDFAVTLFLKQLGSFVNESSSDMFKLDTILTKMIENVEISTRFTGLTSGPGNLVVDQMSNQTLAVMRVLFEFRRFLHTNKTEKTYFSAHSLEEILNKNEVEKWFGANTFRLLQFCLLTCDHSMTFKSKMQRLLGMEIIQTIASLAANYSKTGFYMNDDVSILDIQPVSLYNEELVLRVFDQFSTFVDLFQFNRSPPRSIHHHIFSMFTKLFTVYLRKVAILIHADYPVGGKLFLDNETELERLLDYLNMPPLHELVFNVVSEQVPLVYEAISRSPQAFYTKSLHIRIPYPGSVRLIDLPRALADVILYSGESTPAEIAVCLYCGETVHLQEGSAYNKRTIGQCTDHITNNCPLATKLTGCFLLVKSGVILVKHSDAGSFVRAPYLNAFGDVDENIRLGLPLFLNEKRYDQLIRDLYLNNNIANEVARKIDNSIDGGGWETL